LCIAASPLVHALIVHVAVAKLNKITSKRFETAFGCLMVVPPWFGGIGSSDALLRSLRVPART
jgi:hypothetical protein